MKHSKGLAKAFIIFGQTQQNALGLQLFGEVRREPAPWVVTLTRWTI